MVAGTREAWVMNVARRSRQKQSVEITGGWLVGYLGDRGHVDLLVLCHERGVQDRHSLRNAFIGDLLIREAVWTAVEVHLSGVVVGILPIVKLSDNKRSYASRNPVKRVGTPNY